MTRAKVRRIHIHAQTPLGKRLLARTAPMPDGCTLWTGSRDRHGYGRVQHEGRKLRVHRLAWFLHHGPIPDGLVVLHSCDVPECVAIAHLRLGTQAENLADAAEKGRTRIPVRKGGAWTGKVRRIRRSGNRAEK